MSQPPMTNPSPEVVERLAREIIRAMDDHTLAYNEHEKVQTFVAKAILSSPIFSSLIDEARAADHERVMKTCANERARSLTDDPASQALADTETALPRDAEIERLRKIERAAADVCNTITGGFVVCKTCGDQEDLTDIDFADDLRAALNWEATNE